MPTITVLVETKVSSCEECPYFYDRFTISCLHDKAPKETRQYFDTNNVEETPIPKWCPELEE